MAECFCGCGRTVRFGKKRLSAKGQRVREVVYALETVSRPIVASSEEHREKIDRLIDHGHQFGAMLAGVIHGEIRPPDMQMQRQFFAWSEAAEGVATAHVQQLREREARERKRQMQASIDASSLEEKRAFREALREAELGRPLTAEDRDLMDLEHRVTRHALDELRRSKGDS